MDTNIASQLPNGAFIRGVTVNQFKVRSSVGKNGRPNYFVEGQILAGEIVANVSERVESVEGLALPGPGQQVIATLAGDYRAGNTLVVGGHVQLLGVKK